MAVSKLAPMRYKNFVWPHNPRTYTIDYERRMAKHDPARGQRRLEVLGMGPRIMRGEGEFVGPGAYDTFKALASVFYEDTPGTLVHPVWQAVEVYFVGLALAQEPRADYVRYTFEFWEQGSEAKFAGLKELKNSEMEQNEPKSGAVESASEQKRPVYHTVAAGESLWAIGRRYGVSVERMLILNPELKNPNLIHPGEKVRVE